MKAWIKKNTQTTKIVLCEHLGFLSIIVLCFLNELLKLPSLVFSSNRLLFLYQRSTLEMLLILAVWFLVVGSTRRLLKRLKHLEDFMRVCAWCRRIDYKGEWIPIEDFLEQSFDTPTTHGICKECLTKQKASIKRAKARRKQQPQAELDARDSALSLQRWFPFLENNSHHREAASFPQSFPHDHSH